MSTKTVSSITKILTEMFRVPVSYDSNKERWSFLDYYLYPHPMTEIVSKTKTTYFKLVGKNEEFLGVYKSLSSVYNKATGK